MSRQRPIPSFQIHHIGIIGFILLTLSIIATACDALQTTSDSVATNQPPASVAPVEASVSDNTVAAEEPDVELTALPQPTAIPGPSTILASDMVDLLRAAEAPFFDIFDWNIQLGLLDADASRTRESTPRWTLDDVETFDLPQGAGTVEAELKLVTTDLLIWIDTASQLEIAAEDLQPLANLFSESLADKIRQLAGNEWSPGMDGTRRIHLVYAHGLGNDISARFDPRDEYPTAIEPRSAEREVIYFNLDQVIPGDDQNIADLARELWRMIQFNVDPNEATWAANGQLLLSQRAVGFEDPPALTEYLAASDVPLNATTSDDSLAAQGASYLYFLYLQHKLGNEVLANILQSPLNGFAAIDAEANGSSADTLFHQWSIANLIDDSDVGEGQYGHDLLSQVGPCPITPLTQAPQAIAAEAMPYSIAYYEVQGGTRLDIDFAGTPTSPLLNVNAFDGSSFWWSRNVERSASSITRSIDLTQFATSVLNFALWHDNDAEKGNVAYVLASIDEGQTWLPMGGLQSSEIDNLIGYAGVSGGGEQAVWVQERIDLTPLAGQEFLLRFVYVTGDSGPDAGFAIDNISIAEAGLFDGGEALDSGWDVEGWVRTSNQVENRWGVFLVTESIAPDTGQVLHQVTQLDVDANGAASLNQNLPENLTKSWIVVALAAPATDFASSYTLTVDGDFTPVLLPQLPAGGIVIEDFNTSCGQFRQNAQSDFTDLVTDGKLTIELKSPDLTHFSLLDGVLDDVAINIESTLLVPAPGATNGYGLVCRYNDDANYYGFELRADTRARIYSVLDGVQTDISPPLFSSAVEFGSGALNNLTVSCAGNQLSLTVNGEVIASVEDDALTSGQIGLLTTTAPASGQVPAIVAFDNFLAIDPAQNILLDETPLPEATPEPVATSAGVCDCSGNLFNCRDFSGREEAQACFNFCGGVNNDVHLLDADSNGIVCETVFP